MFGRTTSLLAVSLLSACGPAQTNPTVAPPKPLPAVPTSIWFEAEAMRAGNLSAQFTFSPANETEAAVLSGGKWVGADGPRSEVKFAEYDVNVPKDGTYTLFARKFWKHGPYRWRFDNGPWKQVGDEVPLLDGADMRQFVGANWTPAGEIDLKKGTRRLRIELTRNDGAAAFDCFLLTDSVFIPRGKMKPGEKYGRTQPGWFGWEPEVDPFAPTPLDLRSLNEKFAGENGWIRAKGEDLVHEKTGKPVRFWAANAGPDIVRMDHRSVDYLARSLAKHGVNMVRLHGGVWKEDLTPDKAYIEQMHYFVAAMKREGIYVSLSIYFPLWINMTEKLGFAGYTGKNPFALLYFSEKFQAIYREWWRALLTETNPYTGLSLAKDPAVAIAELVNEDSYFFWTFTPYENVPGPQMEILEKQFGAWAAKRHGSVREALAKFGGTVRGDNAAQGRIGLVGPWQMANERSPRAQAQIQFLTESQKKFYDDHAAYLKTDLGYQGLVYGSNWVTADARVLGPLDKYSNAGLDLIDRHGYFGGPNEGPRASYTNEVGDRYMDRSALNFKNASKDNPNQLSFDHPVMDLIWNGKPSIITETMYPTPNRFRAEGPLWYASYGALQGTDGIFSFALTGAFWNATLAKWPQQAAHWMAQSNAALIYRKGLVKEGPVVLDANVRLGELYQQKGAPLGAPLNLDALRQADVPRETVTMPQSFDLASFLVGKVKVTVSADGGKSRLAAVEKLIDHDRKLITSATNELKLNYGVGLLTINAPAAQGATGFFQRAGKVTLRDIVIDSPLEYGAISLVALDDQPIATSKRMMLQVMTEEENTGFQATKEPYRQILNLGVAPTQIREIAGTITFKSAVTAQPLDPNGKPMGAPLKGTVIRLPKNAISVLITR